MTKINVFSHCFQSFSQAHPPSKPLSTGSSLVETKAPTVSLKVFRMLKTSVAATYFYQHLHNAPRSGWFQFPIMTLSSSILYQTFILI